MSNQNASPSHLPNFTFFDEKWSPANPHPHATDPTPNYQSEATPINKINENTKHGSFSTCTPYLQPIANPPNPYIKDPTQNFKSNPSPQAFPRALASKNLRNKSPLLKRSPSGSEFLLGRFTEYIEESATELKAYEKLIKPRDIGKEAPLVEVHVSDIRRRMRSYHPIQPSETEQKNIEANFQDLHNKIEQEIRKTKRGEMSGFEMKMRKKQNVDQLFDKIKEESNRRIHDIVQNLRMIRKQDVQFHEKIVGELKELNFLRNELTKGFEKLQQKSGLESSDRITQKVQKKLLANCENCTIKKGVHAKGVPLTERSHSPHLKHLRATSHAIPNSHREYIKPEEPKTALPLPTNEYQLLKDEEIYRKDGKKVLGRAGRASSLTKMDTYNTQPLESEEALKNKKAAIRKYFVAADQNQKGPQKEDPKAMLNRSQTGILDYSHDDNKVANYYSAYLRKEYKKEDEQRSFDANSRAIDPLQTIPEKWFVKLSKSPYSYGNYTLKFTAAHLTFDVEIKMNETANIDFSKKLLTAKPVSHNESSSCSKSHLNLTRFDEEFKTTFSKEPHVSSPSIKKKSDLDLYCEDCTNKIEGMKATLQNFLELDQKATKLDASHSEEMLKLLMKDAGKEEHQFSEEEIKSCLKKACRGIENAIDSCFDIAPSHAQKIEKLFKGLLLFFELKVRAYVQAQNNFLKEIEQGKLVLKEKKKIGEEVAQLKEEKLKLAEDLKIANKQSKDSSHKYEEQIKVLIRKIEELKATTVNARAE